MKEQTLQEAAKQYANNKSSAPLFQEAHIADFKAGANWAMKSTGTKMLSQQEPVKGVEELKEELVAEIYSLIPNGIKTNEHALNVAKSIINQLELLGHFLEGG